MCYWAAVAQIHGFGAGLDDLEMVRHGVIPHSKRIV